jgi:hypothetical protein
MKPSLFTKFSRRSTSLLLALSVLLGLLAFRPAAPNGSLPELSKKAGAPQAAAEPAAAGTLAFQSAGQTLSFQADSWIMSDSTYAMRVKFAGANPVAPASQVHNNKANTSLALDKVTYTDLWDGITLTYDAPAGSITGAVARSTYILAPGANPADIQLTYNAPAAIDPDGSLVTRFDKGLVRESKPVAWQEIAGQRSAVAANFTLDGQQVGFSLGSYDHSQTLYIDPTIILGWNTLLGGVNNTYGGGVVVGSDGSLYYAGYAWSQAAWTCSPTPCTIFAEHDTGSLYSGATDGFVAKLDSTGHLLWNTFLGSAETSQGNGSEAAADIAVDASGNVYVTGEANRDWAWANSALRKRAFSTSAQYNADTFVAKLDTNGGLIWYTFLGSSSQDFGTGIALDASGNVYVSGTSGATWGTPLRGYAGGEGDAMLAKLNNSGVLQWNTFYGTAYLDQGDFLALDSLGNIWIYGSTNDYTNIDLYLTKFSNAGAYVASLKFTNGGTSNLGLSYPARGKALTIDSADNIYVTGYSDKTWGSPVHAFAAPTGKYDGFAAKFNSNRTRLWNTFFGSNDTSYQISVAGGLLSGSYLLVTGNTRQALLGVTSTNSPYPGSSYGGDGFLLALNAATGGFVSNTYTRGGGDVYANGIAMGSDGVPIISGVASGVTSFSGAPAPISTGYSGGASAFLLQIGNSYNTNLLGLGLSTGTLIPALTSSNTATSFTALVSATDTSLTMTPTGPGTLSYKVGTGTYTTFTSGTGIPINFSAGATTTVYIQVLAADNVTTQTYTITIRPKSSNANLIGLALGSGAISPTFIPTTTSYTLNLPYATTVTDLTATVSDTNASMTLSLNGGTAVALTSEVASAYQTLLPGANTLAVTVTAEDGSTKTYTVIVSRATVSALSVSAGSIIPAFSGGVTSYSVTVPYASASTTVTATTVDGSTSLYVKLNGGSETALTSGTASDPLALLAGQANTIEVLVRDSSTTLLQTYTITITRAAISTNNNLSGLSLSAPVTSLTPTFAAATTSYTASVNYHFATIDVTPAVADSTASIQSRVNAGSYTAQTTGANRTFALNVGANTIDFKVTAEDSSVKTYTVTITRQAASNDATLSGLTLSAGTLSPAFSSATTSGYTAGALFAVTSLNLTPACSDTYAAPRVQNNSGGYTSAPCGTLTSVPLSVGSNVIDIQVTAQDGISTQTYTLTFTRAPASTNNNLNSLSVSAGSISPAFSATATAYTLSLPYAGATSTTLTASTADSTAAMTLSLNAGTAGALTSGSPSASQSLRTGDNTLAVAVTAEDGSVKTYTVTVTRSALSALTVSAGSISPTFAETTSSYTAATTSTTTTVTAASSDAATSLAYSLNGESETALSSGAASGSMNLLAGVANTLDVIVRDTATSALRQTYRVTIRRPAVFAPPASKTYYGGEAIDFTVTYGRAVTVDTTSGTPTIALTVGDSTHTDSTYQASYLSGSGSTTLTFRWTVAAGLAFDDNGISAASTIVLNGGSITESAGDAVLLLTAPDTSGVKVLGGLTLTLNTSGFGSGIVTPVPGPDILSTWYMPNTAVVLTAAADTAASPNSRFIGWTGDLTGTTNPASITLTGNLTITAWFDQIGVIHVDPNYGPTTPGWGVTRFATVQSALKNAQSGDKVVIAAGTYPESITLPDPDGPANVTLAPDGGVKFGGTVTQNGGTLLAPTGTLTFGGSFIQTGGTFDPNGGTVVFDGSNPVITSGPGGPLSFKNLRMEGTGTLTSTNPFGVTSLTTISSGALNPASGTHLTDVLISSGGTLALDPTDTLYVSGSWTNNGSFTPNGGTVVFDGTGAQTVGGSHTTGFASLTVSSGSVLTVSAGTPAPDVTAALTVGGSFTPPTGTDLKDVVILSGGTLTAPAGNFNVSGSWTNDGAFTPGTGTVTFNGASAQVIGGGHATSFNNLTINNSGSGAVSFDAGTPAPAVTGTLSLLDGTFEPPAGSDFTDISIAAGSLFSAPAGTITVSGTFTNDGSFTANAGKVSFDGTSAQEIKGAAQTTFYDLDVNNTGGTLTGTTPLIVTHNLTLTAGSFAPASASDLTNITIASGTTLTAPSGTLTVSGSFTNDGTFTPGSGTVSFDGTSAQVIGGAHATSFNNLTVNNSGSGAVAFTAGTPAPMVTGLLNLLDGTFQPPADSDFGDITIAAGSTFAAPAGTITVSGTFTNDGTFTANAGKVSFDGSGAQEIKGAAQTTFYDLDVNKASGTLTGTTPLTVTHNLTVSAGAFAPTSASDFNDIYIASTAALTAPSGTLTASGNFTNNGTFTAGSGTLTFDGASAQVIGGAHASSFNNLTINNSATGTVSFSALTPAPTVTGLLNLLDGTFQPPSGTDLNSVSLAAGAVLDAPTGSLTVSGDFTNDGAFNPNGGTVTFDGTGAQVIGGSSSRTFANLTVANTSASAAVSLNPAAPAPVVTGVLTVSDGSFAPPASSDFADVVIASGAELSAPAGPMTVSGSWTNNGTFTHNAGTVTFDGAAAKDINGSSTTVFYNMSVDKAGAALTGSSALSVSNDLEVVSGSFAPATGSSFGSVKVDLGATLTAPSGNLAVSGSWNNSGTFTPGSGTVTLNGSTAQAVTGTANFNSLVLNNPAGVTSANPLTVAEGFTLVSGAFTPPSGSQFHDITINSLANLSGPAGSLKLSGDWTNNGTFTPGSSTVTFNGSADQALLGSTTTSFNALTVDLSGGHTLTASTALTTSAAVTIQNGTFDPASGSTFNSLVIAAAGTFTMTNPETLVVTNGVSNSGSFHTAGGTLAVGTSFTNASGGFYAATGGTVSLATGSFTNSGTYNASGGTLALTSGDFTNYAVFSASGASSLTVGGSFTNAVTGTFSASGGSLSVAGNLVNANTSASAFSPTGGTITLNGATAQQITGSGFHFASLTFDNAAGVSAAQPFSVSKDFELVKGTFNPPSLTQLTNVQIDSGATFVLDNTDTLYVAGNFNNQGTFTPRASTIVFNGSTAQTIASTAALTLRNMIVDNTSSASPAVTASIPLTVTSSLTVHDGEFRPDDGSRFSAVLIETSGTLSIADPDAITVYNNLINNGVFAPAGGSVDVWGAVVNNGTFAPSGGSLSVGKEFTNALGAAVTASGGDVSVNGDFTNAGTLSMSAGSLSLASDLLNSGSFSAGGTSTVSFDGGVQQQISGSAPAFANLVFNNPAGVDTSLPFSSSGVFDLKVGSFNPADQTSLNTVNIFAGAVLHLDPADTLKVAGDVNTAGSFEPNGSTLVLNGSGAQNVGGSVPYTFANLVIQNSGSGLVTTSQPVSVTNTLTVTDGTFAPLSGSDFHNVDIAAAANLTAPSGNLTVSGSWTDHHTADSGFSAGTGSVTFDGTGVQNILGPSVFNDLTVAASSTLTLGAGADLGLTGQITLAAGGALDTAAHPHNTLSILGDGTPPQSLPTGLQLDNIAIGPNALLACPTHISVAGDWINHNLSGNVFSPNTCTVTFNGSGDQTIDGGAPTHFSTLVVDNSGGTVTAEQPISTSEPFVIHAGAFDPAGGSTFASVVIETGGTWTQTSGETVTITGSLTNSGSLAPSGGTLNVSGDLDNLLGGSVEPTGGIINVSGNWNNYGVLAPSGGTLNLFGDLDNHTGGAITPTGGIINLYGDLINDGDFTATENPPAAAPELRLIGTTGAQVIGGTQPVTLVDFELDNPDGASSTVPVDVTGSTKITDGTFTPAGGSSFHDVVVDPSGGIDPPAGGGLDIDGSFVNNGSLTFVKLDAQVGGTGSGTITVSPKANYFVPSRAVAVTLSAAPDTGSAFTGWSGDSTAAAAQITLTMSADRSVSAVFIAAVDLQVTMKIQAVTPLQLTLQIVVTNLGPGRANGAVVDSPMPAYVSAMNWTCTTSGGASCGSSGSGALHDTLSTLPAGGSATYTVTVTLASPVSFANEVTVTAPFPEAETITSNNTASVRGTQMWLPIISFGPLHP